MSLDGPPSSRKRAPRRMRCGGGEGGDAPGGSRHFGIPDPGQFKWRRKRGGREGWVGITYFVDYLVDGAASLESGQSIMQLCAIN